MTGARMLGFGRDAAVRISFVMSLPVIAGAVLYKTYEAIVDGIPSDLYWPMAVGIATSCLSGLAAVWGTLRLVRTRSFTPFVIYRIVLGVFVLVLIATGVRDASF
jgi:undecaprenyl-diphosphatase